MATTKRKRKAVSQQTMEVLEDAAKSISYHIDRAWQHVIDGENRDARVILRDAERQCIEMAGRIRTELDSISENL